MVASTVALREKKPASGKTNGRNPNSELEKLRHELTIMRIKSRRSVLIKR